MPTNDFYLRWRYPKLAGKKRAQLGICFAALWCSGNPDFQRTVRKLARDFGFRTFRSYLYPKCRRWPLRDALFQELMQDAPLDKAPRAYGRLRRKRIFEAAFPEYPLQ